MEGKGIQDLPEEVFEYILSLLSPYRDLKNCMLVCRNWRKYVEDVVRRMQYDFQRAITDMHLDWHHLVPEPGPTITRRYSHSTCCHGTSMYVFGGCTTTSTTFNDLWRLDLATREWIRPLAMGTYPSPKACATMVCYRDNLFLFGGWTHPSPYPLHQAWKIFNQLHVYNPNDNRWTQIVSQVQPPAMAGHSATVHGDKMVVFGGLQRQSNGQPYARSNDVWILDLNTMTWNRQDICSPTPPPRYGQSQIYLNENHALVIGGCGGPNMLFSDVWLLTLSSDPFVPWKWKQIVVNQQENAAPHLWCHPACRVGKKIIVLSRGPQSKVSPTNLRGQILRPAPNRIWIPPHQEEASHFHLDRTDNRSTVNASNDELCVNGKKGTFRRPTDPPPTNDADSPLLSGRLSPLSVTVGDIAMREAACTSTSMGIICDIAPSSSGSAIGLDAPVASTSQSSGSQSGIVDPVPSTLCSSPSSSRIPLRNTPFPSVRPNPMRNRQRQLEGLRRMEERIRNLSRQNFSLSLSASSSSAVGHSPASSLGGGKPHASPICPLRHGGTRNPMAVYVADISQVLETGEVTWLPLQNQTPPDGPEDTILYSLVEGRGELIMFGGIHKDPSSATAGACGSNTTGNVPETVSNTVHFILPQKWVI